MMSRHKTPSFKKIGGCFLLVVALHYVLDEPTRSVLLRAVFRQRNLPLHNSPAYFHYPDVIQSDQSLLHDASFELWDMQPQPTLREWLSSVTISASLVVKQETEILQHGRSAVRLEHDGAGHCGNVRQELPHEVISALRGRQLKFSVWALSMIPEAPCLHIQVDDEPVHSTACLQHPSGTWQPVTVERVIGPDATRIVVIIDISRKAVGEIRASVYVDNASLVVGPPPSPALPSTTVITASPPSPSSDRR